MNFWIFPFFLAIPLVLGGMILWEHPFFTWHDQQRLGQIVLSVLCMLCVVTIGVERKIKLAPSWSKLGTGLLLLGIFSATLATHPLMAAVEVGLLVISIGMGNFVFLLARRYAPAFDLLFGGGVRLLLAGLVFAFYVSCISAYSHPSMYFHPWALLSGFSNARFEGQFLTIAVPLLWGALQISSESGFRYPRFLDSFLAVSLVCMVFVAGTRGSVLAWLATGMLFVFLGRNARKLGGQILVHLVAGYALAWGIVQALSAVTGHPPDFRFDGAQILGLSAREILWEEAWKVILQNPWLGIGPMHFADLRNSIAAHPHQALLQIASEWGVPACFLVIWGFLAWSYKCVVNAQKLDSSPGSELRWALLFSVFAAACQSMVDGVLVMPYPQIWLAAAVGWAAARCLPDVSEERPAVARGALLLIWAAANVLLVSVALFAYPKLVGAPELSSLGGPRLWCEARLDGWW